MALNPKKQADQADSWNDLMEGRDYENYGATSDRKVASVKNDAPKRKKGAEDAIIYLPGVFDPMIKDVRGLALRLKAAFHKNVAHDEGDFVSSSQGYLRYGSENEYESQKSTILRNEGKAESCIVDLYQLDYRGVLMESWNDKSLLGQVIMLLHTIIVCIGVIGKRLCTCSTKRAYQPIPDEEASILSNEEPARKGRWSSCFASMMHLLVFLSIFTILTGYLVLLALAVVRIGIRIARDDKDGVSGYWKFAQDIVVLVTFIAFLAKPVWKNKVSETAVLCVSLTRYYTSDSVRRELCSQLDMLMKKVQAQRYKRIHLVGYSLGSVLATDSLFPRGAEAPPKEYAAVDSLVTFGCPFDMFHIYLPWYYSMDRQCGNDMASLEWTNICVPADVLGSTFRDDQAYDGEPCVNIRGQVLHDTSNKTGMPHKSISYGPGVSGCQAFFKHYLLAGLGAHGQYWSKNPLCGNDVSGHIVKAIFTQHEWALKE